MAGRKVFTSGEILTAADVNSFLMNQVVAVFADDDARSSAIPSPSEGMVTYVEDANRVEVFDGSAFGPIGGILQVVSSAKTDSFSTTSGTFTPVTGLSVSITPSTASSKILIFAQISHSFGEGTNTDYGHFKVTRGGTDIYRGDGAGSRIRAVFGGTLTGPDAAPSSSITYLDSPNTVTSVTYQVETRRGRSGTLAYVNRASGDQDVEFVTRGASSITVLEVAV